MRLYGTTREILDHPEIAELYLGGHVARDAAPA